MNSIFLVLKYITMGGGCKKKLSFVFLFATRTFFVLSSSASPFFTRCADGTERNGTELSVAGHFC